MSGLLEPPHQSGMPPSSMSCNSILFLLGAHHTDETFSLYGQCLWIPLLQAISLCFSLGSLKPQKILTCKRCIEMGRMDEWYGWMCEGVKFEEEMGEYLEIWFVKV